MIDTLVYNVVDKALNCYVQWAKQLNKPIPPSLLKHTSGNKKVTKIRPRINRRRNGSVHYHQHKHIHVHQVLPSRTDGRVSREVE
jgi:hypothetical protein